MGASTCSLGGSPSSPGPPHPQEGREECAWGQQPGLALGQGGPGQLPSVRSSKSDVSVAPGGLTKGSGVRPSGMLEACRSHRG